MFNRIFLGQNSSQQSYKKSKKWIWILSSLIIIISVMILVPFVPVFDVTTEEKTIQRELEYIVYESYVNQGGNLERGALVNVIVVMKNVDDVGGNFTVIHTISEDNGLTREGVTNKYMAPDATKTFIYTFDINLGQNILGNYTIIPPIITDNQLITIEENRYVTFFEYMLNYA